MQYYKAAVLAPYRITEVRLPSIDFLPSTEGFRSNIKLGNILFDCDTTVGELSKALISNNKDFRYGDELLLLTCRQLFTDQQVPKVAPSRRSLILSPLDDQLLSSVVDTAALRNDKGFLALSFSENEHVGAFALIHYRSNRQRVMVSTQELIVLEGALYESLGSEETQREAAIDKAERASVGRIVLRNAVRMASKKVHPFSPGLTGFTVERKKTA